MLTLKVPDMSCGHCAATIEKAVKSVDPAAKVKADIEKKTVSIDSAGRNNRSRPRLRRPAIRMSRWRPEPAAAYDCVQSPFAS